MHEVINLQDCSPWCVSFYVTKIETLLPFACSTAEELFLFMIRLETYHTVHNLITNEKYRSSSVDYERKVAGSQFLTKKNYNAKDYNPEHVFIRM